MKWRVFLQSLNVSSDSPYLEEEHLQFELGDTTFVLEHDEEKAAVLVTAILTDFSPENECDAAQLLHFLKMNMRLQSLGLGAIACDVLEAEFVWRREWQLCTATGVEVLEAMQQIDAMRSEMIEEGWIPAGTTAAANDQDDEATEATTMKTVDDWLTANA